MRSRPAVVVALFVTVGLGAWSCGGHGGSGSTGGGGGTGGATGGTGDTSGNTGGTSGNTGGTSGGTGDTSGGTGGTSGNTGGTTGGTGGTSGGTGGTSGGTGGTSGGTGGTSGGTGGTSGGTGGTGDSGPHHFAKRVVTTGLAAPWQVTWGPDGYLWLTERVGKRVIRVNPDTGARVTVLSIPSALQTGGQDGVLGMALHPGLLGAGPDYVYVASIYDAGGGARRARIQRYTYDRTAGTLGSPVAVITGLPASTDHNAGRLVIGPDLMLYYSVGDQGGDQLANYCKPIRAQQLPTATQVAASDWSLYEGKILRLGLDGSIPTDNPLVGGVRSHVFTYGHRNPQGLAFGDDGTLYSSEQGPKTDDEVNVLVAGKNYGWPFIAGYQDDKAYVFADWSASSPTPCAQLTYSDYDSPPSVPVTRETDVTLPDFAPPIATFYTVDDGHDFKGGACGDSTFICWPTIAPASIAYYGNAGGITPWRHSLLVPSLKRGTLFRLPLAADGQTASGPATSELVTTNRYRDVAMSPDGLRVFVITDSSGTTGTAAGGATSTLDDPGAVLEFSWVAGP